MLSNKSIVRFLLSVITFVISCDILTDSNSLDGYYIASDELALGLPDTLVDTTGNFRAEVYRRFDGAEEKRLLQIAEATYPDVKSILAGLKHPESLAFDSHRHLWWSWSFDGVRIPFALTGAAVQYYLNLISAYQHEAFEETKTITMLDAEVVYEANVSWHEEFELDEESFKKVYVVDLKLRWSGYCGILCGLWFGKDRTVVFNRDGKLLRVSGDGHESIAVS